MKQYTYDEIVNNHVNGIYDLIVSNDMIEKVELIFVGYANSFFFKVKTTKFSFNTMANGVKKNATNALMNLLSVADPFNDKQVSLSDLRFPIKTISTKEGKLIAIGHFLKNTFAYLSDITNGED